MDDKPRFSTNKIIVLTVFICAALMTSLFVFHLRHKAWMTSVLPSEDGVLFPIAREIQPFELTANAKTFTLANFKHHWTLLFFGFSHCSDVCPTTLTLMNRAYRQLYPQYPNLQIVFVSLDPERDTPAALTSYVHAFNADFIGATGTITELRRLQSQFGIFSARDANNAAGDDYQILHTSSILLIDPQGKWVGLFKFGMTPEQLAHAFATSLHLLSQSG